MSVAPYYDAESVTLWCEDARAIFEARNAYVRAWLNWRDCPLGCATTPEDEGQTLAAILEKAFSEARAAERAAAGGDANG